MSVCKETALAMLAAGLPCTLIMPRSKKPIGDGWQTRYRTKEAIEETFSTRQGAGVAVVLGDRGDGKGVIDLEIDDPEKAEITLRRIFPEGIPETLTFHSNRGTHHLFKYDYRLSWIGANVVQGEHYPGIEVRIGTTDPTRPSSRQSLIPPTPREGGEPRQFCHGGKVISPVEAVSQWETLVSPLPDALFKDIDLFHNKNAEDHSGSPQWGAEPVKQDILKRGSEFVLSLVSDWGLRLTGKDSGENWKECHAIGREDKSPSAQFDPTTGVYLDFGDGERKLSIFALAVELGVFPNFPVAVNELGRKFELPPTRSVRKVEPTTLAGDDLEPWSIPCDMLPPEVPPYPIDVYPKSIAEFLGAAALAVDCPPDYLGTGMIACCGAAIGNSTHLAITESYSQPPHLFTAFIGPPGNRKTSAVNVVSAPLIGVNYRERSRYLELTSEMTEDERKKHPPLRQRIIGSDSTKEAIAQCLADNPRGLGMPMDEIAGLVANLNAYRGGRGDDRQFFLSVNSGATIQVNRKGSPVPLVIRNPCLSIWGPLTPSKLTSLKGGDTDDGWFDRFLLSYPATPVLSEEWKNCPIPEPLSERWRVAIERLAAIEIEVISGTVSPRRVSLTEGGNAAYADWFARLRAEMNGDSRLRGPWSKLEGYCLRIALILGMLDSVSSTLAKPYPDGIDADAVRRACKLADYHKEHAKKVYQELSYRISGTDEIGRKLLTKIATGLRDQKEGKQTSLAVALGDSNESTRTITHRIIKRILKLGDDELDPVIEWCIQSGYLQQIPLRYRQGRPSVRYAINPLWDWEDFLR